MLALEYAETLLIGKDNEKARQVNGSSWCIFPHAVVILQSEIFNTFVRVSSPNSTAGLTVRLHSAGLRSPGMRFILLIETSSNDCAFFQLLFCTRTRTLLHENENSYVLFEIPIRPSS
jgi:hypothetical protein